MPHVPVLLNESIEALNPKQGEFFIDGTFGGGGHSKKILEKIGEKGKLLVVDWDEKNLTQSDLLSAPNVISVNENYAELPKILKIKNLPKADGLLLDLGFSSDQLENSGRGFSFKRDEPLLLTYSQNSVPVNRILKDLSEKELTGILSQYGEERYAKQIAGAIYRQERSGRPIQTSGELAALVSNSVPRNYERGRLHPAVRTFQALRIYANRELENLERILKNLGHILKPGGRVAIISFHSLEDRLVKNYFRDFVKAGQLELAVKKPIVPTAEEIARNPRSRSAKLRAAKII